MGNIIPIKHPIGSTKTTTPSSDGDIPWWVFIPPTLFLVWLIYLLYGMVSSVDSRLEFRARLRYKECRLVETSELKCRESNNYWEEEK